MKVIIAGSRGVNDIALIYKAVARSYFNITEVVSGTCHGPDKLGEQWAHENNVPVQPFKPKWHPDVDHYNPQAGFERNTDMANYADALIAIWDGQSKGTKDMIKKAKNRGLKVFVLNLAKEDGKTATVGKFFQ